MFGHNASSYDFHFIIQAMEQKNDRIKFIKALPFNTERFRQIQINSFCFKDSLHFLNFSLDKLSQVKFKFLCYFDFF